MDGIQGNDGILVVGSTNHLDRLDPGISHRPSRFDRKYVFDNPDFDQRVRYCQFWQTKLKPNTRIDFPDVLCSAIAKITDEFSFAYIQEAFVATLVAIGVEKGDVGEEAGELGDGEDWEFVGLKGCSSGQDGKNKEDGGGDGSDLDKYVLWREIKMQIKILRREMEQSKR